jgi:hypothetical protein
MTRLRLTLVTAGVLCASLAAFGIDAIQGREGLGASLSRLTDAGREGADLDADLETILACVRAKEGAARDLVAGRLSFGEAVGRFRAADGGRPPRSPGGLPTLPGDSAEERYARCVLASAEAALADDPGSAGALARLSAEYRAYLNAFAS